VSSIVPIESFVDAMQARWSEYGNVTSPALRAVWSQIGEIFNTQISAPSHQWPVIPAELGVGKTMAAKTYCSLLPSDARHPGVLVVVRTIDQAEDYAQEINAWSEQRLAFAYHSDLPARARRDLAALVAFPVLVICHRAYEVGLDALAVNESYPKFRRLHEFRASGALRLGRRRLVIVDEALDQVHESRVQREVLKQMLARIPRAIEREHLEALDVIESVIRVRRDSPDDRHRAVAAEELLARTSLSVEAAEARLQALWETLRVSNRVSPAARVEIAETLTSLRRHLAAYRWLSTDGERTALSGNRLLLMPADTHGVVLDATGRLNNVYSGRPDQFKVVETTPVRDYSTVTIYAAKTIGTGRWHAKTRGEELAAETLGAVLAHYGERAQERRVLVVVAMDGEEAFRAAGIGFKDFDTAHWNKIDGRNVFLRLPNWRQMIDSDRILEAVGRTLPGVKIAPWTAVSRANPKGQPPRVRQEISALFIELAKGLRPGERRALTRKILVGRKASAGSFYLAIASAQEPGSDLNRALADLGTRVEPGGHRVGISRRYPAALVRPA
jgi:hypothetical protein